MIVAGPIFENRSARYSACLHTTNRQQYNGHFYIHIKATRQESRHRRRIKVSISLNLNTITNQFKSGIGFSVAQACLEFGAQVVIASSNQQRVDEAVKRLQASTSDASKVSGKTINLSRGSEGPSSIDKRVEEFLKSVGKFDHYVHSAGENLSFGPISEVDFEAADRMFE